MPPWIPNALTALRIALVPAFLVHAYRCVEDVAEGRGDWPHRYVAAAALFAIGLTDVLDGWIARRYGLATQLGATLDAVADKLAQFSALVFFVVADGVAYARAPLWLIGLLLARDVIIALGYVAIRTRRGPVEVVHESHGRFASLLLYLLVGWIALDLPRAAILPASVVIAAIVGTSTLGYVREGWRQWRALPAVDG